MFLTFKLIFNILLTVTNNLNQTFCYFTANLKKPIDEHVRELSNKVVVVRNAKRSGLIKSRLAGAAKATGDVIVFLDSHCETTPGWVEPLLARIAEDRYFT